jgi:hypothetical protein
VDLEQPAAPGVVDERPLGIEPPLVLAPVVDALGRQVELLARMDRARGRDHFGGDVGDAIAEVLERQLVEGEIDEPTVSRRIPAPSCISMTGSGTWVSVPRCKR